MILTRDASEKTRIEPVGESRKSILMLAYYFPPGEYTGAQRPFRFARYIRERGLDTYVITSDLQTPSAPWKDCVTVPPKPALNPGWFDRFASVLQRLAPYNDQLTWVPPAVSAGLALAARVQPCAIVSTAPPFACHVAALLLKQRLNIPWIADFRDPLLDNPMRNAGIPGRIYDAALDYAIVSRADAIIANTDSSVDAFRRRYLRKKAQIHLIWNGYDPESAIEPRPIPERPQRVLLHAGSLYGQRQPIVLLNAMVRLIGRGLLPPDEVKIRLLGYTDPAGDWLTSPAVKELSRIGCLENTFDVVPRNIAIEEIQTADTLLLLDINEENVGIQVPAKLFEYVQTGRPIIAVTSRNSPTERILAASGVRHICIYQDSREEEVDARLLHGLRLPTDPVHLSASFMREFDGRNQSWYLADLIDNLTVATSARGGGRS
jgi:glycosyltransferase involved in cell wall biosynthesis